MKTNTSACEVHTSLKTHEGAPAAKESAEKELTRAISCCMLWEDTFYEKGSALAERIEELCSKVSLRFLCQLAIRARTDLKLRHIPLWLCVQLLKQNSDRIHTAIESYSVASTINQVIQRADELSELVSLYWKDGKKPLASQLKKGLAAAFRKFNEYQLSKYNRDSRVKLRDVLFLCHAKPQNEEQDNLWKKLIAGELAVPDTWELSLSTGADKKETFTRLLIEKKLGYMALLRNLRNMEEAGVDRDIIQTALIEGAPNSKALPFRFIAAAKVAPKLEAALSEGVIASCKTLPKLFGRTLLVVDVSGSMQYNLSQKSAMSRVDAANGLAMLIREQGEDVTIYATAGSDAARQHDTAIVPARHGFSLSDAILEKMRNLGGGGIFLVQCMEYISKQERRDNFDRVIVITDEQDCDIGVKASEAKKLATKNYIINVGTYEPALPVTGAGWTRISGFSERVIDWIIAEESQQ